jgi:DNA-binding GntR family transcriptional regulator
MMNIERFGFESDARPTIAKRIAEALRDAIVSLDLKPGDAISESEIAARFGVSRQPVREAFIQLSEQGLLRIRPQRSTEVVRISIRDVLNARFVREALEVAVVRKATAECAGMPPHTFDDLYLAQTQASDSDDYRAFHAKDDAFHRRIAKLSGNEFVWKLIDAQKVQMDRVRYLSLKLGMPATIREHRDIGEAILSGNPDLAEAHMRKHLRKIDTQIHQIRDLNREYFGEE